MKRKEIRKNEFELLPEPLFKQVTQKEIKLDNEHSVLVPIGASHISFKRGWVSFWLLEKPKPSSVSYSDFDNFRSTNKRWFFRKMSSSFSLPEFQLSDNGKGYKYGSIKWS